MKTIVRSLLVFVGFLIAPSVLMAQTGTEVGLAAFDSRESSSSAGPDGVCKRDLFLMKKEAEYAKAQTDNVGSFRHFVSNA